MKYEIFDKSGIIAILSCYSPEVKHTHTPMSESGNNLMACGMQLYFSVSYLAINVEHLVVSPLYMFHTAVMSYSNY